MKGLSKENETQNDVNVFVCLMNECAKYGWYFKDRYHQSTKQTVERFLRTGSALQDTFEKHFVNPDDLTEISEAVGVMIQALRKGDDERFNQIIALIKEFDAGEVKIVNDDEFNKIGQ